MRDRVAFQAAAIAALVAFCCMLVMGFGVRPPDGAPGLQPTYPTGSESDFTRPFNEYPDRVLTFLTADSFFLLSYTTVAVGLYTVVASRSRLVTVQADKDAKTDRSTLRQILVRHFDEEELRSLVFDLDLDYDYDSLRGEGKAGKARELVAYLYRHGRLSELGKVGPRLRPDVPWEDAFGRPKKNPTPSRAVSPERSPRLLAALGLAVGVLGTLLDATENAFLITYALLARNGTPLTDPALPTIYVLAILKRIADSASLCVFGLAWPREGWLGWVLSALMLLFPLVGVLAILLPVLVGIRGVFLLIGMPLFAWDFWRRSRAA